MATMYDEFSYLGTWWMPSDPEKRWSGVVTYKPETGIELELVAKRGDFGFELKHLDHIEVLHGEVSQYPHNITLLNLSLINEKFSISRTYIMFTAPLRAEYLLVGKHYGSVEDITFSSLEVVYSSQSGWMQSISQTELNFPDDGKFQTRRRNSIIREVCIPHLHAKFVFCKEPPHYGHFPQACYFLIVPNEPQDLPWFCEIIDDLRDLLTFLIGRPVESKAISMPHDKIYTHADKFVSIYRRIHPVKEFHFDHQLDFSFVSLGEHASEMIETWFELDEDNRVPFELCLDVINNIHGYKKFEFLALMQALESHHQLCFERDGRKNKKYKTREGKPKKNGPDLMDRLKELRGNFPGEPVFEDGFLDAAKVTRDYYTHYNPKKRKRTLKGPKLDNAISRLIPFVAFFLYFKLGMSTDTILYTYKDTPRRSLWQRKSENLANA